MLRRLLRGAVFFLLLAVALSALSGLGTVIPPATQAIYTRLDTPFNLTFNLTANSTANLTACNVSVSVPTGFNLMAGNTSFSIPLVALNVSNITIWTFNASHRGSFFVNPAVVCDGQLASNSTNWTIHADVLNITSVAITPSPVAKNSSVNISATVYHLGGSYGVNATEVNVSFEDGGMSLLNCSSALVSGGQCTARLSAIYGAEGTQAYTINVTSAEGSFWSTNISFTVIDDLALRLDDLDTVPLQPREFAFNVTAIVNRTLTSCWANVTGAPQVLGEPNRTLGTVSGEQALNWRLNTTPLGQFTVTAHMNCSGIYESTSRAINVGAPSPRLALSDTVPTYGAVNTSFSFDTTVTNNGTLPTWVNVTLQPGSLNMTSDATQSCRNESNLLAEDGTCTVSWTVTPKAAGTVSFNITLQGNGTSTNVTRSLTVSTPGTLEVPSANLDFGIMAHGTTKSTLSFLINETSGAENLYNITWYNNTISSINFTYASVESLAKSSSVQINVTLTIGKYKAPGAYAGSVIIAPRNGDNVTLNYTVNVSRTIECDFSSSSYSVSSITQGASADFDTYVTNLGNVPVNISVSGNTHGDTQLSEASAVTGGSQSAVAAGALSSDLGTSVTARSDATTGSDMLLSTLTSYCTYNSEQYTSQASLRAGTLSSSGGGGGSSGSSGGSIVTYSFSFWAESYSFTVRQGEVLKIPVKVLNSGTSQITDMKVDAETPVPLGFRVYPTTIPTIDAYDTAADTVRVDIDMSTKLGKHNVTLEACHTHDSIKECHKTVDPVWIDVLEATEEAVLLAKELAEEAVSMEVQEAENVPEVQNMSLAESEKTIIVDLPEVEVKSNVTAEIVIKDLSGNVLYTVTRFFESMENISQVTLDLESELPEGQYQVFVSMKDLAGTLLNSRNVSLQVTGLAVKAAAVPTQGAAGRVLKNLMIGLLISSFVAFMGIWGYTGEMPLDMLLEQRHTLADDVKRKARDAFAKGEYGRAESYQKKAKEVSKAEKQIRFRIEKLEEQYRHLYTHGMHAKAREMQAKVIELRRRLAEIESE